MSTSSIELSTDALKANLEFIRNLIGQDCILSSVVKGNAYGHGIEPFTRMLINEGVNHFSVFSAGEAKRVYSVTGHDARIMIMGHLYDEELEWAIENNIEFFVFDSVRLEKALKIAQSINKQAIIHLELETGMNRTGFDHDALLAILPILKTYTENYILRGMCTHYAGAESISNYHRVNEQIKKFEELKSWLNEQGIESEICHTACSAASIRYPETQMDLVRVGILQYGFWPSKETFIDYLGKTKQPNSPLKGVLNWKSRVMNLKSVTTGEFVGYGISYIAEDNLKIAAIPVGYAYGYDRGLSNLGRVLVNGHRVGVIGIVNMNMMLVDVTPVEDIKIGDEVVIIGQQGDLDISVASFSELSNQLNYEMLTRLPQDIPRHIR